MKTIVKEVRAKLPNGFTFLVDFTDSEVSEVCKTWEEYYSSKGIKGFEIFAQDCKILENFNNYNYWAIQLFGTTFNNLSCRDKLSVVEISSEIVA